MWDQVVMTRAETKLEEEESMVGGKFVPVEVAIGQQGGGSVGVKRIQEFFKSALASGNLQKYISVHSMTKALEIAVPQRRWADRAYLSLNRNRK